MVDVHIGVKVKGEGQMRIGELSRRTGVARHQLRYYESQGLLAPARGGNGYRDYAEDAVVTVTQIRRLLEAGLSTDEIAYLQPCLTGTTPELEPCPPLLETLGERLADLDRRIDALRSSREALSRYVEATRGSVTTA